MSLREGSELTIELSRQLAPPRPRHDVIVLVQDMDEPSIGALQYARQLNPLTLTAIHIAVNPDHARELTRLWAQLKIPVTLEVEAAANRNLMAALKETVAERVHPDTAVSVVLPERTYSRVWQRALYGDRTVRAASRALTSVEGVEVFVVPTLESIVDARGGPPWFREARRGPVTPPASRRLAPPKPRHEVLVLTQDLDRALLAALRYARQLSPLAITATHIAVDPDHARELTRLWARSNIPVALEVVDSPDRNLIAAWEATVTDRLRPDTAVSVVLPDRSYSSLWYRILRGDRTAQAVSRALSSRDVALSVVPFQSGTPSSLATILLSDDGPRFHQSLAVYDE
jgi:hypothetical protein